VNIVTSRFHLALPWWIRVDSPGFTPTIARTSLARRYCLDGVPLIVQRGSALCHFIHYRAQLPAIHSVVWKEKINDFYRRLSSVGTWGVATEA
jgi:hypothetical protein